MSTNLKVAVVSVAAIFLLIAVFISARMSKETGPSSETVGQRSNVHEDSSGTMGNNMKPGTGSEPLPSSEEGSLDNDTNEIAANSNSDQDGQGNSGKGETEKDGTIELAKIPDSSKSIVAQNNAMKSIRRKEASGLKETFAVARENLSKNPLLTEDLFGSIDELAIKADAAFNSENFREASLKYQEATETGKKIAEEAVLRRQQKILGLKNEAIALRDTFKALRNEVTNLPEAEAHLTTLDTLATRAKDAFEKKDFSEALSLYRKAIDSGHEISNSVKNQKKKEANDLLSVIKEMRMNLNKYKGLSAEIAERIVKVDVTSSIARESIHREEFEIAVEQLQKSLNGCKAILRMAEDKFQAASGNNFTDPKVGIEFVWIESIKIWVSKYEVTNGDYRKFKPSHDSKKSMGFSLNRDAQPAIEISYYDAVGYCEWMNAISLKDVKAPEGYVYRLPDREEWETVARCDTERLYPWGNEWPPLYGNFGNQEVFPSTWQLDGYSDDFPVTCDVTKSGANEWGLYGMAGNIWEWTTDIQDGKKSSPGWRLDKYKSSHLSDFRSRKSCTTGRTV